MKIAEFCILVACLLPIVCAGIAKSKGQGSAGGEGSFDNHNPRAWLEGLQGWQARANAAQLNSFEALPLFIASVLVAQYHLADQSTVNALAVAFIVVRVGYIAMYLLDKATIRSALWSIGLLCCVALFFV